MQRFYRTKQSGFTILEALIAFAVLSMIVATTYSVAFSISDKAHHNLEVLEARQLARSLYEELSVDAAMPLQGRIGSYQWNIYMNQRALPEDQAHLVTGTLIDVEIRVLSSHSQKLVLEQKAILLRQ